jgi:hypothetical protein
LRTGYTEVSGAPVQVVNPPQRIGLPIADLNGLTDEDQKELLIRCRSLNIRRVFELGHAPWFRTKLMITPEDQVLDCSIHHMAVDRWSLDILKQEVSDLGDRFRKGLQSGLEELRLQFADFVLWQREYLSGQVMEEQLAYWRNQLAGGPKGLDLRPRQSMRSKPTNRGAFQSALFPLELSRSLSALCAQEGVTQFMLLLAVLQSLLFHCTGQEDIWVGCPVTFRNSVVLEKVVGYFTNVVILRGNLSGNPTFRELLKRLRDVTLGAFQHQDLPFELLLEHLRKEAILDTQPPFQVWFNYLAAQDAEPKLGEQRFLKGMLEAESEENDAAIFDLAVSAQNWPTGLAVGLQYRKDVFDFATIRSMLGEFGSLLEQVAKNPGQRVSRFEYSVPC